MDSNDIKPWQAEKIHDAIGSTVRYLGRLQARLDKRGFDRSDRFYQEVARAHDALHALSVSTHYLSFSSLGRPPSK